MRVALCGWSGEDVASAPGESLRAGRRARILLLLLIGEYLNFKLLFCRRNCLARQITVTALTRSSLIKLIAFARSNLISQMCNAISEIIHGARIVFICYHC